MRRTLPLCLLLAARLAAAEPVRVAQSTRAQDEQTFREFEQIVADFSPGEQVQAWEAFLQKYPGSSFGPKVREILAELRGERPAATPAPAVGLGSSDGVTTDEELDRILGESAAPPTRTSPAASATPRPGPTPAVATPLAPRIAPPVRPSPFVSAPDRGTGPTARERLATAEAGSRAAPGGESARGPDALGGPSRPPRERPPARAAGVGKPTHTEVAGVVGFTPEETYVRHLLAGMTATQRFGRTWGIHVEALGAQHAETDLLVSLREAGTVPQVITSYNVMAGAFVEANLLSAIDRITGQVAGRNDLYLRGGGGVVNVDLEICKPQGPQPCDAPLYIDGANFGYGVLGLGHRLYVTRWLTLSTEVRGRLIFELIDNETTPRGNVQINVGPTVVF